MPRSDQSQRRVPAGTKLSSKEAKDRILKFIEDGLSIPETMKLVKKSEESYYYYLKSDPIFARQVEVLRVAQRRRGVVSDEDGQLSFSEFRAKFLNSQTFAHQQNVVDLIENRPPSWLHENMIFEQGQQQFVVVNMPPEHAKSMTVSIDYITYRLCLDPNVRIKVVSKTRQMAEEFVYAVKQRLTSPMYAELQGAYAPPEGFKAASEKWKQDQIYLSRESSEKDPSLQALGIGGQIYGARADLIILDDCVTLANAGEYEKQIRWIQQEVLTRVGPTGKILVVGTRVDPVDMYRELRNPDRYPDGVSPWTYLAMPAVLDFAEDPQDWVTLWPRSDRPWPNDVIDADADGLYPRWDGKHLRNRRGLLDPKTWAMVYQQQDVESDAVFSPECVRGAVNGRRGSGLLHAGAVGYPEDVTGFYTVCAMDPAMSGDTFSVAYTGDRKTKKRYLMEANRMPAPTPARIRELIFSWTEKYKPQVWVIEKNAFQLFLTQDELINQFLASRGIKLVSHYTGANKMDVEYGVASMAPLFGTVDQSGKYQGDALIELPRTSDSEHVKALIEQLITWSPGTKNKQDGPMALWMAETAMRDYINQAGQYSSTKFRNPFATRRDNERRQVVDLEEYARLQQQIVVRTL